MIEEPQQNSREGRNVEENFIKRCLNDDNFINKLKPNDITIASAMAMSAAAMSPYLGKNKEIERQFSHFLTVFGIEMAAQIVYEMTRERGNTLKDKLGQVGFPEHNNLCQRGPVGVSSNYSLMSSI